MSRDRYTVILVPSSGHAIRGENVLHRAGITVKLIPVPRSVSSDCGVCLRVERGDVEVALQTLEKNRVEIVGIHEI